MTDRKMPVKIAVLDFTEDGYPGFTCKRRLNATLGMLRRLSEAESEDGAREGWLHLFPEWDFVDEEGAPIPHTPEGFDAIPQDLWQAMVRRGMEAVKEAAMPSPLNGSSSVTEVVTA